MPKNRTKNSPRPVVEEPYIKDFLDMVAPSVIDFKVDHYLCGNTCRCVWALREYPTSTDEQAILRHLGEMDGVTIRIYTRQVTPSEERRIIHNAANKHRMSRSSTEDLQQTVTAEANLQDVVTLVSSMHRNREPLLHCAVFLELTAPDYDALKLLQTDVLTELVRSKLNVDRLMLRQQEGFVSVMPAGRNAFGAQFERVLPASSVANLYPFNYSGKTDPHGFYIGKDKYGANMVSLILQNLYREILTVADENGGRLKNRVVFFADELGTCPPIQSLELMFSASRSRGLMLVPIVQSITGQLQKNYGKEGSEIIVDNCQVNLYGGFAPASQTAVELSKSLGSRTVMSGSISRGKNDPSQSLQMMERPLMTPDELKSMPKGSFIVAKTGVHPMKVKLRLFLDWGIRFGMPYEVPEKAQRFVAYADKQELEESIIRRHYGTIVMDSEQPQGGGTSAGGMAQGIQAAPDSRKTVFRP